MMASAQHLKFFMHNLYCLQKQNVLCDLSICTGNESLFCHSVVLVANSTKISQELCSKDSNHDSLSFIDNILASAFQNINKATLEALIEYMYTGRISLKFCDFEPLLLCAKKLRMPSLVSYLEQYGKKYSEKNSVKNSLTNICRSLHSVERECSNDFSDHQKTIDTQDDNQSLIAGADSVGHDDLDVHDRYLNSMIEIIPCNDHTVEDLSDINSVLYFCNVCNSVFKNEKIYQKHVHMCGENAVHTVIDSDKSFKLEEIKTEQILDEIVNYSDIVEVQNSAGLSNLNSAQEPSISMCESDGQTASPLFVCENCGRQYHIYSVFKRHKEICVKKLVSLSEENDIKNPGNSASMKNEELKFKKCNNVNQESPQSALASQKMKLDLQCNNFKECFRYKTSYKSLKVDENFHVTSDRRAPSRKKMKLLPCKGHFRCFTCYCQFKYYSKYKIHLAKQLCKHVRKGILFDCQDCGKQFMHFHTLKLHRKIFHKASNFKCKICKKKLRTLNCYKNHLKSVHLKIREQLKIKREQHICEKCGKTYKSQSGFVNHVKHFHQKHLTKSPQKSVKYYKCGSCTQEYYTKIQLLRHGEKLHGIPIPQDEYRFKCQHCGRWFLTKADYEKHVDGHIGRKLYSCDICGNRFSQASAMQRHRRTHQELHIECTYPDCSYRTYTNQKLADHIQARHAQQNQWFCCCECNSSYKTIRSLRQHVKKAHDAVLPRKQQTLCLEKALDEEKVVGYYVKQKDGTVSEMWQVATLEEISSLELDNVEN